VQRSVVVREGQIIHDDNTYYLPKLTLDTGASCGNYIGRDLVQRLPGVEIKSCQHSALLGDGKTQLDITNKVILQLSLYDDDEHLTEPVTVELYIIDTLGEQIIIGLPSILGEFFDFFVSTLHRGRVQNSRSSHGTTDALQRLTRQIFDEISRSYPRPRVLRKLKTALTKVYARYATRKRQILADTSATQILVNNGKGEPTVELVTSRKLGTVYADDRIEDVHEILQQLAEPISTVAPGELVEPWSADPDPESEEILATPDPLSFSEDVLHFMEVGPEEARKEYLTELPQHISPEMLQECPQVRELLCSEQAMDVFAPLEWNGLKIEPATFTVRGALPKRLTPKARPIRPALFDNAAKEFDRLLKYFYTESESPIASPLVIAPKATAPFIRFCGDYREVNQFIDIPQQPIPIVKHELMKAAKYKVFIDLDMANSFHQIPLSREFSDLLSVQTPWGLYRPKFLPEGVGPASGLLQHIVRDIFADFSEWTIVIFDNFLVLADSHQDAYSKLQKIIARCHEKRIVLKLKKSWIGVDKVTFFGYELTHGKWQLSDARKAAIAAMTMPQSAKEMQSFLGAALFFHNHVPDYTEWSARLYEMTHADFVWDPGRWEYDYVAHFEQFKEALQRAAELYFPDYSLQWIVRCDASQYGVGAVLFQEATDEHGSLVHQPIAFSSKRFSKSAKNWDTYKREAFAIYFAVDSFNYYLRGKSFILETDHRNLVWIEASQAPIVVRWRALLQSYSFLIRHIPGKENTVADWMSRMGVREEGMASHDAHVLYTVAEAETLTLDSILHQVHGGRSLHYGASETWRRAKELYPDAHISIHAVRDWVRHCPLCQKLRRTGITGLPPITLTLKPEAYRSTVGVDHITVTPADDAGNTCIILIVEHFSHFPQAYPAKDYSADSVARALFKHFCTFGCFETLCSDPGSAFMSEVVQHLNRWLGIRHKVSLIGRHESNGCEGSGKQYLRHLKALVADERLSHKWSDDTVLPLINFELASYPTSETGGYTPFQLKYGTRDATFYRLPEGLTPGDSVPALIRALDENIRTVRELSLTLQRDIAAERRALDKPHVTYEPGDLILWNPRENPCDHLPNKLDPDWLGPYEVISHVKNDVECRHLVLHTTHKFHVTRVKPFFGGREDAIRCAKLDQNQYYIRSITRYTGNPHVRSSMSFTVLFEDGEAVVPWNADLANTQQYEEFVNDRPALFPLRFTAVQAKKKISAMNKLAITTVSPGDVLYLSLRYFDGTDRMWYDGLKLPDSTKLYVVQVVVDRFADKNHRRVSMKCATFSDTYTLTHYEVYAYCTPEPLDQDQYILVTPSMRAGLPRLFM
jgi:RNase H-like domain found in reverse transcriptase/Reverse transcriptase (RNA-dependent DNA polymerase)